jgi:hypothetical protein
MDAPEEARKIVALGAGDAGRAVRIVEDQMNVLHARAQVLLSLAGVVITVTGFSGRAIAAAGVLPRGLLVAGLGIVLCAAIWVFTRVAGLKWVTSELGDDLASSLEAMLRRRNAKTCAYRVGGRMLFAGLVLYCAAVVAYLFA